MCDILIQWRYLNGIPRITVKFKKGAEKKIWRLSEEEERAVTSRYFSAYGRPLEIVTSFRYLGRVISAADDNWMVVVWNL